MKDLIRFALFAVATFLSGCGRNEPISIEYVPTPGETATISEEIDDSGAVKHRVEIFPSELFYGDVAYVLACDENVGAETILRFPDLVSRTESNTYAGSFSLTALDLDEGAYRFEFAHEPWRPWRSRIIPHSDLEPGATRVCGEAALEFPSLRSWESSFWTNVASALTPDGVKLQLEIDDRNLGFKRVDVPTDAENTGADQDADPLAQKTANKPLTQEIVLRPRPEREMKQLETWREKRTKSLPDAEENSNSDQPKKPVDSDLTKPGSNGVRIGWRKYNPWLFIRYDFRKPSSPNNPTTLDGWRELEASMTPSTMRDEIRLTRLQLEYYSAKKGAAAEKAQAELIDWLASLPKPQQFVMTTFLLSRQREFSETALRDKNRALLDALRERLDSTGFLR